MTEHQRIKLNHIKSKFKDFDFEEYEDGILILNHQAKMGVKLSISDLDCPLNDIVKHINKGTRVLH